MNIYRVYNRVKAKLRMLIKTALLIMLLIPFLSGCRIDEADYELTNYTGKSVDTFEKKTKTQLTKDSNGVYKIEGVLQLMAPKEAITSVTLLEGAKEYKVFGVVIG
ncbi:MAG TPA: hypothetical protein GX002_06400, partial [Clostridiales bacterium]|nr:hypothetical protein [Clostridiales bacterium]